VTPNRVLVMRREKIENRDTPSSARLSRLRSEAGALFTVVDEPCFSHSDRFLVISARPRRNAGRPSSGPRARSSPAAGNALLARTNASRSLNSSNCVRANATTSSSWPRRGCGRGCWRSVGAARKLRSPSRPVILSPRQWTPCLPAIPMHTAEPFESSGLLLILG
jgi:hypothetical protein